MSTAPTKAGSLADRLRQELVAAGDWLTTAELIARTGAHRSAAWEALKRLHKHRRADRFKTNAHTTHWRATGVTMELSEAKNLVSNGAPFGDVYERLSEADRLAFKGWYVTSQGVPNLAARARQQPVAPRPKAEVSDQLCKDCGGFMVRTGTCFTCQACGNSSGGCG